MRIFVRGRLRYSKHEELMIRSKIKNKMRTARFIKPLEGVLGGLSAFNCMHIPLGTQPPNAHDVVSADDLNPLHACMIDSACDCVHV